MNSETNFNERHTYYVVQLQLWLLFVLLSHVNDTTGQLAPIDMSICQHRTAPE